jgi:polysaccharide biosynthesis transport protein
MNASTATASAVTDATKTADPRAYARVLWRWRFVLLAFLVVIPLATYLFESSRQKVYQSSSLMEVNSGQQISLASLFNQMVQQGSNSTAVLADARLITTSGVAQQAVKYLHDEPAKAPTLVKSVNVTPDQNTGFISITASAPSPRRAADIANAFAQAIVANQTQAAVNAVNSAIGQLQRQINVSSTRDPSRIQLVDQLARFRALQAAQESNVQIVDPAAPAATPVAPRVIRSVVLALIVALLLGVGAVALAETSDRRARHPDDVADAAKLPLLSAIPSSVFASAQRTVETEEAFATLRAALTYFNVDRRIGSVLITSPGKEDGKTTVTLRLAESLARAGKDVIAVDADLRRPALGNRCGVSSSRGLGSVLVGETLLDEALVELDSADDRGGRLRILPAGPHPPNPSELLGSRSMQELLSELAERCDILLVDSTPLLTVSDSMPLLRSVSGIVLIGRVNRTSRDAISRLRAVVQSAGGKALGVVATGAQSGGLYVARGYRYDYYAYGRPNDQNGSGLVRNRRWGRRTRREADKVTAGEHD